MVHPFIERSKHRKLIQWAIAYLAAAWLLLQLLDLLANPFRLSDSVLRFATVVLAIGFLAALVVAWYHGEKGAQRVSGRELFLLSGVVLLAGGAVVLVGSGTQPRAGQRDARPSIEQSSIAVLPFVNMSSDAEQEYFSDGLTEELLNVLAQVSELRVASRTSSFTYKGSKVAIDSVAKALRVAYVLEGSVRKSGDRIRITAQLIRADNGYHAWSNTYNRALSDVFAIQDEISRSIVAALLPTIVHRSTLARQETRDPEAHNLVMQGAHLAQEGTRPSYERAVTFFQQAIKRDSLYARAHAELSRVYSQQAYLHFGPRAALVEKARASAERALRLDSLLSQAHYARAEIARLHDWDFVTAEAHFRRAVELKPGLAAPHSTHGWLLSQLGRTDEAVAEARRAAELDPVSVGMLGNLGAVYTLASQFEPAVQVYKTALELEPNDPINLGNLALTYSYMGRHSDAVDAAQRGAALAPDDQYSLAVLAYTLGRAQQHAKAQETIRKLEAQPEASSYLLATAYAGLDQRERVLRLLERAVAEKDPAAPDLSVDPTFRPYRTDARVRRLLAQMGLG